MDKKIKKFFLLIGILLLLLLILSGAKYWNRRQEEKQEKETEAARIYVTDLQDISGVSYNVGNGEFTFAKQDGIWIYTEDEDFPLKQSVPEQIADTFGKLEAERELKDGDNLAAYGLEEPVYTVALTTSDGQQTVINFGNTVDDSYYLTVEESGIVYTAAASVLDELQYTMDELAQFDTYPTIGSGNLVKETIIEDGKTTIYDSENDDDAENIVAVAGGLGAVKLEAAADYSVADEELVKYGLDEDSRITVKAVYTQDDMENELILYIGNENGGEKRYVMVDESRIVYLISNVVCDNILNKSDES